MSNKNYMSTPTRFWLTQGNGESDISKLSAIDESLMHSGIGYQNHVIVSSIPPSVEIQPRILSQQGVTYVPFKDDFKLLPPSSILYVVRAIKSGVKGDTVACCIALVKVSGQDKDTKVDCVLAYESTGSNLDIVKRNAIDGLNEMVERRNVVIDENWGEEGFKISSSFLKIEKEFGSTVSFVVMDPFTFETTS